MKIQEDTNFIIQKPDVEEQVSYYSDPKKVVFKKDPQKNKIELKSLASFWSNLYERDILTKEIASKASIKLSSRNYYKLKLMQLYSDKFMSMNDLFNASLAFATASEIKINEPNAFKLQEYEEFSKIILRTTRYFLTKGDSSELKTVELIDFSSMEIIFLFWPNIFSVVLTKFIICLNSAMVNEALWSGPTNFLLIVTCFSIIVAPRLLATIGAK